MSVTSQSKSKPDLLNSPILPTLKKMTIPMDPHIIKPTVELCSLIGISTDTRFHINHLNHIVAECLEES